MKPPFSTLGLDHVVLRVRALEPALAFYTGVLDGVVERRIDALGLVQVRLGRSLVDLIPVEGPLGKLGGVAPGESARNVDHFCLRIESFEEAALRAFFHSRGVELSKVHDNYGSEGTGPSVYFTDPEGNSIELKGPAHTPAGG